VLEFLDIVDEEVDSANKVITDLLSFSRVAKPAVSLVNVGSIIRDALNHVALPENVKLTANIDSNLPMVMVDGAQIRQVFINIILNAAEAMPEGGYLEIGARSKGDFVTVEFIDTGCGIPESVIGKIFDPLFTTKPKGVGLGLATCRSIVERHGGDIGVRSKEGGGTTFTLSLPTRVV
jgi:signal transduction histidine kinase